MLQVATRVKWRPTSTILLQPATHSVLWRRHARLAREASTASYNACAAADFADQQQPDSHEDFAERLFNVSPPPLITSSSGILWVL